MKAAGGRCAVAALLLLIAAAAPLLPAMEAAPAAVAVGVGVGVAAASPHLQLGVQGQTPILIVTAGELGLTSTSTSTSTQLPATMTTEAAATAIEATTTEAAVNSTAQSQSQLTSTATPLNVNENGNVELLPALNSFQVETESPMQLIDLEQTSTSTSTALPTLAPQSPAGHDGLKRTKKKQLLEQHFLLGIAAPAATTTTTTRATITAATTHIESEMERIPTTTTTTTSTTTTTTTTTTTAAAVTEKLPKGFLGPIFMGEKIVAHPLKKPLAGSHEHEASIETQLRNGRIVEILAAAVPISEMAEKAPIVKKSDKNMMATAKSSTMLSSTVFQVPELPPSVELLQSQSTTRLPKLSESKISDIQIEVYDSTVDSIVASTNFRDNDNNNNNNNAFNVLPLESTLATSRPATPPQQQERFTQYVIDRADVSTQQSSGSGGSGGSVLGKPEPAAIEIHINVSEAFGNESEDLEFSYRQPNNNINNNNKEQSKLNSAEILVVEIIDSADNITENSVEHSNPIFTFRSEADPPASVKYVPPPALETIAQPNDELFMADLKSPPPPPPPPPPRQPSIDRDSDTIFYISNTEVKVGESLPTASSSSSEQQRKYQLENQFFPLSYSSQQQRTTPAAAATRQRFEEDIILSPLHSNADALKIFRSSVNGDGAPPLDVTYVGESVIEVEQSQSQSQGQSLTSTSSAQPDIIIQPAVLPDLAIGVPVIGELPPQIELKEIDYMPGELSGSQSGGIGIYENDIDIDNNVGGDPDVVESSIQYGGDLIDDGAGGGYDGVERSYPFDSAAHRLQLQLPLGHGVSHLHREELPAAELLNATTLLQRYANESANGVGAGLNHLPERVGNATALSEDPLADYDGFLNLFAVTMGLVIVILPAALLVSMYCAIRYFLNKHAGTAAERGGSDAGDDSERGEPGAKSEPAVVTPKTTTTTSTSTTRMTMTMGAITKAVVRSFVPPPAPRGVESIEFQFEPAAKSIAVATVQALLLRPLVTSPPSVPNGSVTKMTLKDNHLIVVTEERHDISRNARETKMHTDKDGVFVVEVARGIDAKQVPDSPGLNLNLGLETTELPFDTQQANGVHAVDEQTLPPSHEQVQIHAPPSDFASTNEEASQQSQQPAQQHRSAGLQLIEELPEEQPQQPVEVEAEPEPELANTGLSQSDLSSSSSSDSNKRYSYGNQELYVIEQHGYVTSSSTAQPMLSPSRLAAAEEHDRKSENGNGLAPTKQNPTESETETEKDLEKKAEPEAEAEVEELEEESAAPVPAPAAFGNHNGETDNANEAKQEEEEEEEKVGQLELEQEQENNYDSLMSLPAPPSNEEFKELNDYTLGDSNQLDSLPPPPPPTNDANGNGNGKGNEEHNEDDAEEQPLRHGVISNGNGNGNANTNGNGNILKPAAAVGFNSTFPPAQPAGAAPGGVAIDANVMGNGKEPPATLTPPASPPATPPPPPSIYGAALNNGHGVGVGVNGS